MSKKRFLLFTLGASALTLASAVPAFAQEAPAAAPAPALLEDVNTLWVCLAAFLVFWMQAGFALVETGFTRAKSAGNICMKNLMDFCIGTIAFWALGYGLMFGTTEGWFGTDNFLFDVVASDNVSGDSFKWAFFIFQLVFCATSATIVSGAMAERTKFNAYLCYSAAITLFIYPISGGWIWNAGGWLFKEGFHDFAGSTVVHAVGGWAALAGAIMVGPRIGKYINGKPQAIPGHSLVLGCLGVFILWLGWFGFNPGSTTAIGGGTFAKIAVTTNAAGAAGAIAGMFTSWIIFKKPDISFILNGCLAGLVGVTAGCNVVSVPGALAIGASAGVLVVFACLFFDRIGVDDPVGAVSVHGICGTYGTLCVGFLHLDKGVFYGHNTDQLVLQLKGIGACFLWAFFGSLAIFALIKYTIGLRVSEQEEIDGLDIHEHGVYAYPPQFVVDSLPGSTLGGPLVRPGMAHATTTESEPAMAT